MRQVDSIDGYVIFELSPNECIVSGFSYGVMSEDFLNQCTYYSSSDCIGFGRTFSDAVLFIRFLSIDGADDE